MTFNQCFVKRLLRFFSLFLTALTLISFSAVLHVEAQPDSSLSQTAQNQTTIVARAVSIPVVTANRLPPEARSTINLIRQGGPFPYAKDGTVFQNRERRLPQAMTGYYREYTVKTPGVRHRGHGGLSLGKGAKSTTLAITMPAL